MEIEKEETQKGPTYNDVRRRSGERREFEISNSMKKFAETTYEDVKTNFSNLNCLELKDHQSRVFKIYVYIRHAQESIPQKSVPDGERTGIYCQQTSGQFGRDYHPYTQCTVRQ